MNRDVNEERNRDKYNKKEEINPVFTSFLVFFFVSVFVFSVLSFFSTITFLVFVQMAPFESTTL